MLKKGQFLAPWGYAECDQQDHRRRETPNVLACERGVSFGYNTLVVDMRSIPIMKEIGCPIVFDATHSVQQPGGQGSSSGGQRKFAPHLARAAVSLGIAAVFMETHPDPDNAPSDGPNMIPVSKFSEVMEDLKGFDALAKARKVPEVV